MIATGNHNYFDSLRGAPPWKGSLSDPLIRPTWRWATFPPGEGFACGFSGEKAWAAGYGSVVSLGSGSVSVGTVGSSAAAESSAASREVFRE